MIVHPGQTLLAQFSNLLHLFRRFLNLNLVLLFSMPLAQGQGLDGTQGPGQIIAGVEISQRARQQFLEEAFKSAVPHLEDFIKKAPLKDQTVGSNPEICSEENLAKMGFVEAWQKCPGIPDYFFKDGSFWTPNFSPRPIQLDISQAKIDQFKLGKVKVKCEKNDCMVEIPLQDLELAANINVKSLNKSKNIKAGESILEFQPLKFKMNSSLTKESPYIRMKVRVTDQTAEGSPVQFVPQEAKVHIPTGSIRLALPDRKENLPIGEVLNNPGKLSIGPTSFYLLTKFASAFVAEVSQFSGILDLNMGINDHFAHDDKMQSINQLLNSYGLQTLVGQVNTKLNEFPLFKGMKLPMANLSLQDLVDHHKWENIFNNYTQFIQQAQTQIDRHEIPHPSLQSFQIQGQSFSKLLTPLSQSRSPHSLVLLNNLEKALRPLIASISAKQKGDFKKGALWDRDLKEAQFILSQINATKSIIQDNLSSSNPEDQLNLKLIVKKMNDTQHNLGAYLIQNQSSCSVDNAVGSLTSALDSKESVGPVNSPDLAGQIHFSFLNGILKNLHQQGKFNFCLVENEWLTCSHLLDQDQLHQKIILQTPPQIQWNAETKSHDLEVEVAVPPQEPQKLKIQLNLHSCPSGEICLNGHIDLQEEFLQHKDLYQKMINALVKYVASVNPLTRQIPEPEVPTQLGGTVHVEKKFAIPGMKVQQIQNNPQGIKMQAELK